jgi:methenyltetrahydromethanopterin cyclohydrolase
MLSINREAMKIVHKILEAPEAIGVEVSKLSNGTTIIDMGLKARGGWVAGKYYTQISLGGIGEVSFENFPIGKYNLHAVRVLVDLPMEACLGSQIAGWRLEAKKDAPIGAGPARSLNKNPDHYMDLIPYRDNYTEGVLAIQTPIPITVETADSIAKSCGLKPENLYILVAASASLATAVQVSARIIEQTLHRLDEEGFDVQSVKLAEGYCVIPPLASDEIKAFGWINDAILYGGISTLHVESTDEAVSAVIDKIVTSACSAYGRPFVEIYEDAGRDFYNIPLDLHSPAAVQINNMTTGRTFRAGAIAYDVLLRSYFGE